VANPANSFEQSISDVRISGPGCVDPELGRRLLAYSLDRLPVAEEIGFEAHMLECDHCFEALRGLDQIESILRAFVDLETEPTPHPAQS
jgi:hypothetical protein